MNYPYMRILEAIQFNNTEKAIEVLQDVNTDIKICKEHISQWYEMYSKSIPPEIENFLKLQEL